MKTGDAQSSLILSETSSWIKVHNILTTDRIGARLVTQAVLQTRDVTLN
jgi:hypothetical protein